jgi:thiol-disulfide isomerase/thioredoxin
MKTFLILLILAILTACSPQTIAIVQTDIPLEENSTVTGQTDVKSALPDLGLAPELDTKVWLNSPTALTLSHLKGEVVLLEMWTFGCINCRNVIPSLKEWHKKYADQRLVIIGNHFPEFDHERDLQNLTTAVKNLGILYPVIQDNEGKNWRAYHNLFWPTLYLIDKNSHIRYKHIGEGSYQETEDAIRSLLAEK